MIITIANILSPTDVNRYRAALAQQAFATGSADWAAERVKHNHEATGFAIETLADGLAGTIMQHAVFGIAARPKRIIGPLFSRYAEGERYGTHVDNPILDGSRADLAFTLFLSDPDAYTGGALAIESPSGTARYREPAGSLILYPATSLHEVTAVTAGQRLAAVGWVRSYIRDAAARELLFELDTARHNLHTRDGNSEDFLRLSRVSANLIRRWCDD